MPAVGRGDVVAVLQVGADAGRDRLLADVEMHGARQLAGGIVVPEPLLHAPDQQHPLVELQQLLIGGREVPLAAWHALVSSQRPS